MYTQNLKVHSHCIQSRASPLEVQSNEFLGHRIWCESGDARCGATPYKLEFHGSSFLVASSCHPGENGANMSRGNRACRTRMIATCPQQVVRVGLVELGEQHDTRINGQHYNTAEDRRLTNKVSAWQAERGSRPTRATSSRGFS